MAAIEVNEANIAEALALASATPQRLAASSVGLDDAQLSAGLPRRTRGRPCKS